MNTFLVRLADRKTGEGQRILVQDKSPSDPSHVIDDMQTWLDAHKDRFDPPLLLDDPVVVDVHLLKIKRTPKTVFPTATKSMA